MTETQPAKLDYPDYLKPTLQPKRILRGVIISRYEDEIGNPNWVPQKWDITRDLGK